jgi:chemotaxis protein methyltransferase CheR
MSAWFTRFRAFLEKRSGVALDADKLYFVESRLRPLAQARGFPSVETLIAQMERSGDSALESAIVAAMLTNETFFFRDRAPFDHFRDVMLPHLIEARAARRHIRIWSAACASGQEAYSLAMILDEAARKLAGWRIEIIATDLSEPVIEVGRAGLYSQFEVQRGLPINHLLRHFRHEGDRWRIVEHLRARVQFRTFNLLADMRPLGQFDVIFCRNVLLYFDVETRRQVLRRIGAALAPDGFLVLGATESVAGVADGFASDARHPAICSPRQRPAARPMLKVVGGA